MTAKQRAALIRQWAREHDYEIAEKGPIPDDIVAGYKGVHSRGSVNWCQAMAGSGGSQGFPAMALLMASSAVMPWAAAESR